MLNFCGEIYVYGFQLKIENEEFKMMRAKRDMELKDHHCIVIHELRTLDFIQ